MRVVDTSITVAAFATWHELHDKARSVLESGAALPAQVAVETYSVLTRLPPPARAQPGDATAFLDSWFARPYLVLDGPWLTELVHALPALGIAGGATYDALIAAVAQAHDASLVTADRRALSTYRKLTNTVDLVG